MKALFSCESSAMIYAQPAARSTVAVSLFVILLALAGCADEKHTPTGKAANDGTAAKEASAAQAESSAVAGRESAVAPLEITVVDKAGFQKAIEAHRGQVVLVDYWATWCAPCVKQFPHTVELWHKHRDEGLVVIALSLDEPDEVDGVRKFLTDKDATFENLISKIGSGETAADEFDFDGALPHYVVYDRDGKLAARLSPSDPTINFRPELIDEAVAQQLAAPFAP
jgi:thiol-disulfide isomerase/thioredoxin